MCSICAAGTGPAIETGEQTGSPAIPTAVSDTMPPSDPRGPLVVFHGTDATSASNIVATGLNVQNATNLGGGDVFWTTTDVATAGIFANTNHTGGTPGIVQLTLPRASADAMMSAGTLTQQGSVYMFQRPSWPAVNTTGVFSRVQ